MRGEVDGGSCEWADRFSSEESVGHSLPGRATGRWLTVGCDVVARSPDKAMPICSQSLTAARSTLAAAAAAAADADRDADNEFWLLPIALITNINQPERLAVCHLYSWH